MLKPKGNYNDACKHIAVEVDIDTRSVTCNACGAIIDPFDYLYECAVKENTALERLTILRQEVRDLQHQLIQLESKKNKLKTQK